MPSRVPDGADMLSAGQNLLDISRPLSHSHPHSSGHDHDGHGHDHGHRHDHGDGRGHHGHAHDASERRLLVALGLTAGFMLAEVIGGLYAGSLALIADAGHMLTDAASLALAFTAMRVSRKPADPRRSYGYDRMQVLAAFVNGIALIGLVGWIAVEAVLRLFRPVEVLAGPMLWIAGAGLLVNLLSFSVLHGGADENLNVRGALAHVAGDLLGSVAAIAAAGVIMLTGWQQADPLLSLLVAGLILKTAVQLTRESAHILLEGTPESVDVRRLETQLVAEVDGLVGVHHVHLWSITPQRRVMTLHAVLDPGCGGDEAVAAIARVLKQRARVDHVTVQVERKACADSLDCLAH
jgi:cobalt-zinc-cadmium efflux system protein